MDGKQLENILNRVEKPGRYIGNEINSIRKNLEEVEIKFAFAFPDFYEIGMSYVGMQILYNIINSDSKMAMERVFAPNFDMEKILRDEKIPLFSLENKLPLNEFDVLGFTLQHEMLYTTILNILDLAYVPLLSKDRKDGDTIVIAGGPCAFNGEPLADFVDIFLIGDGEENLHELLESINESKKAGKNRKDTIFATKDIQGVYIPDYNYDGEKVKVAGLKEIESVNFPTKPIVPLVEIVQDRAVIETFRGCTRGCRFCQAGMITRPIRERSKGKILEIFDETIKNTGHEEVSLLSLSTSDYSEFEPLVENLMQTCYDKNISLSLPSLRLDSFSFNVLDQIQKYKKSGLTFAPEAGTQRLRNVINKSITDKHIYEAISQAMDLGWKQVKLYFMIGLPTETYEDLDGILEIAENIQRIHREKGMKGGFKVNVSVSNFVPKPHTPFQWFGQNTKEEFTEKHKYLSQILNRRGIVFNYHDSAVSFIECLLAKGDRSVGKIVLKAYQKGCKLDGWSEHFKLDLWKKAIAEYEEETGREISEFTTKKYSYEDELPWDIIDTFVSKRFLIEENERAIKEEITLDCRDGNCNMCIDMKNRKVACPNIQF